MAEPKNIQKLWWSWRCTDTFGSRIDGQICFFPPVKPGHSGIFAARQTETKLLNEAE